MIAARSNSFVCECLPDDLIDLAALHRVQPLAAAKRLDVATRNLGFALAVQCQFGKHRRDERPQPLGIGHGATQALAFNDVGVLGRDHAAACSDVRLERGMRCALLGKSVLTMAALAAPAASITRSCHHLGMKLTSRQLDTVDGVRSRAVARAEVPPHASMI